MKTIKELLEPITSTGLNVRVSIANYDFMKYTFKHGYDNGTFHSKIWRPYMCDYFMGNGPFVMFEKTESPENPMEEMINAFLDDYPEFEGQIRIYFDS